MLMKILHIVYNLIRGGTEGQCALTVKGLHDRDLEQRVAVLKREGFYLDSVEAVCGPVYEWHLARFFTLNSLREIRRLARYIKVEGFDLVHTWDADASIFGSAAARLAGVPFITSRRDMGSIYPTYKRFLMRRADLAARAVVVNAQAIKRQRVDVGVPEEKIQCIPNIIDLAAFDRKADVPVRLSHPPESSVGFFTFVHVARMDREKDPLLAVRAFRQVAEKFPAVQMVMAGDGLMMPEVMGLKRESGLDRLILPGDMTGIPALLKTCDAGLLVPNANEGLSNTILEYMAAGLPAIVTDCGGNRELIQDGVNGWIIPVGNEEALVKAMTELVEHPEKAKEMGAAGRQRVERDFDVDRIIDRFVELYGSS